MGSCIKIGKPLPSVSIFYYLRFKTATGVLKSFHSYLEGTYLHPDVTSKDLDQALVQAKEHKLAGICVLPFWAKKTARDLGESGIPLIVAVGYPHGYQMTETKIFQIEQALKHGADEIALSLNLSAFKSGMTWVKIEIAKCAQLVHQQGKVLNVLLDCHYLAGHELIGLCVLCKDAGADHITFLSPDINQDSLEALRAMTPPDMGIKIYTRLSSTDESEMIKAAGIDQVGVANLGQVLKPKPIT